MITWQVLLAGALVGTGLTVIVAGLVPTHPELRAALARLDPRTAEDFNRAPEGRGLAFPAVMALLLAVGGMRTPIVFPAVLAVVGAGVLFVVPDVDLRRRAAHARADMRRAPCLYLELVALERAADSGATEALERAATVGQSREFERIREALLTAEVTGKPAWAGLHDLAAATRVPELGDLADIMRLSGQDGAAVYGTLRARAASLRTQLLTATAAEANAASEHMTVPVALLGVAFMALIGYPAFARIFAG